MQNKTLVININTYAGDYINLNLPIEFVKRVLNNNKFDFFYYREDAIDSEKVLELVRDIFNYNLNGYIGEVKTRNGDLIEIFVR